MLDIGVNTDGMTQMIRNLGATEQQATKALNSTMTKMASWVRTRSVRGLSEKLKIQQKILRARTRTFRFRGGLGSTLGTGEMKVWYGLNPVPWSKMKPRASKVGGVYVSNGKHDPHAFIAKLYGKDQVLRREGKARAPLVIVKEDVHDTALIYIEDFVLAGIEFENQFLKTFERELKWRTSTQH